MPERLKDIFFTQTSLAALANTVHQIYPAFDTLRFLSDIDDGAWGDRELKDRMHHTTRCLAAGLPSDYAEALAILKAVAPQVTGFEAMTFPDFVEMYGLDYWDLSMSALAYFTPYGSAEFAVRPFLHADPERGMAYMSEWAEHPNPHVRRLASEGCRPRLPWGMALPRFKQDPSPILPVLERLKDDESEFVRRSVANNLNDIAKDHPDLTLDIAERWYGHSARTDQIVKHACRSLLKAGHPRAMRLFGFGAPGQVTVQGLRVADQPLTIGEDLVFEFELHVAGEQARALRLEYIIHYANARGGQGRKVYLHSEKSYEPGVYRVRKRHSLADRSTRKHHPGAHMVSVVVNGETLASAPFELMPPGGS